MKYLMDSLSLSKSHFSPCEKEKAGINGEQEVINYLNKIRKKISGKTHLFQNLRIPKSNNSGKWEADAILVTLQKIYVFEVKSFGGQLEEVDHSTWEQQTSRGETRIYQSPLALTETKAQDLLLYLTNCGISISSRSVESFVILALPRITLGPNLCKNPQVIPLTILKETLEKTYPAKSFLNIFRKIKKDFDQKTIIESLVLLPTWDSIILNGGREIRGDIIRIPQHLPSRRHHKIIAFYSPRNLAMMIFPTIILSYKGGLRLSLKITWKRKDSIEIQAAGNPKPELWPIANILQINYGYAHKIQPKKLLSH